MSSVKSRVYRGRVEFAAPSDWPEGVEVETRPVVETADDDLMSPEEIERTLKAMDELEELAIQATDHDEIEEHINRNKQLDKATVLDRLDRIAKGWK